MRLIAKLEGVCACSEVAAHRLGIRIRVKFKDVANDLVGRSADYKGQTTTVWSFPSREKLYSAGELPSDKIVIEIAAEIFPKNFSSLVRAVGINQTRKLRSHIRTKIHLIFIEDDLVRGE